MNVCLVAAAVLSGRTDCAERFCRHRQRRCNASASFRNIDMLFSGKEKNREEN